MLKIRVSVIAAAVLLSIAVTMSVNAAKSGNIGAEAEYGFYSGGDNVQYTLNDAGVMTITGQRRMQDNDYDNFLGSERDMVREIIISEGVTNVGNHVFSNLYNLEKVTLPNSIKEIGESAFSKCEKLKSIAIPEGVTIIKEGAFDNCLSLSQVTLPNSLEKIEDWAFQAAPLKTIVIPKGVSSIGAYNFFGLQSVSVAQGNSTFDSRNNCNAIIETAENKLVVGSNTTVIPATVTCIGNRAFAGCTQTGIVIPESVKWIEKYAFEGAGLTSVTIPGSVGEVEGNSFTGCKKLTSVTFSEGVKIIGDPAFDECEELRSISIPKSVTQIGCGAFAGCKNLTDVYYAGTEEQWKAISINLPNVISGYVISWYQKPISSLDAAEAAEVSYLLEATLHCAAGEKTSSSSKADSKTDTKTDSKTDSKTTAVVKKANTMTVKAKSKTVKVSYSKLKKKNVSIAAKKAFVVKKAVGKVTYKKTSGSKKITVSKSGKITVKKGLKKGNYKIKVKVTAAGNNSYKSKSKTVKLTVTVK